MSLPVILVTGGAGYVGSHTTLELLNAGYSVIAVDNICNAYKDKEVDLPESLKRVETLTGRTVTFYQADIQDREEMMRIFNNHKVDCVIHFAALKAVGESCKIPLTYYQNNITGSSVLLEVMKNHGVYKLVYSSSATVYGTPQYLPIDEEHPTGQGCTNPYGKSKYFVEEIMKDLCTSDPSWGVVSLRYFNPVGAHESGEIGEDPTGVPNNLMPYIAQVAVGRRLKLQVFGSDYETSDGTGVRDYVHITDLAIGHVSSLNLILQPTYSGFRAFNLGTGKGHSVLEVVSAFGLACGRKIPYELAPRRTGDVASMYACAGRAATELGWASARGLPEMCADAWRWQEKNPNGFQKSKSE